MAAFNKYVLAATGRTGNNTHTGVEVGGDDMTAEKVIVEFIVEVAGGTPTVTYSLQGSFDNVNYDATGIAIIPSNSDTAAATRVVTAVGYTLGQTSQGRIFRFYRLVTSLNTNITYAANLWVGA